MAEQPARGAIVTGGGRGIGAAIARTLAGGGDVVVVVDLDGDAAERTAAEIQDGGGSAVAIVADVSRTEGAKRIVREALETLPDVGVLVNNAGILTITPLAELDRGCWDRTLAVNVTGPLLLTRELLPHFIERGGGAVVNITSIAAELGAAGSAAYSASKGALQSLTRALAVELAPAGIRVNAVAPHGIETEMTFDAHADQEIGEVALAGIPVGRFGAPDDIAAAVAYLASDRAAFVTGVTLPVQGGAGVTLF